MDQIGSRDGARSSAPSLQCVTIAVLCKPGIRDHWFEPMGCCFVASSDQGLPGQSVLNIFTKSNTSFRTLDLSRCIVRFFADPTSVRIHHRLGIGKLRKRRHEAPWSGNSTDSVDRGADSFSVAAGDGRLFPSRSNALIFRNSCSSMSPSLRISSKFFRSNSSSCWVSVLESRNFAK